MPRVTSRAPGPGRRHHGPRCAPAARSAYDANASSSQGASAWSFEISAYHHSCASSCVST
jgi:hypothetical protein